MTLPTSTTINNLSRNPVGTDYLPGGLIDHFVRKIERRIYPHPGGQIFFNRKNTGPTPAPYSAGATLTMAPQESTKQTITLSRLGDAVELDIADELSSTDAGDQLEIQVRAVKVQVDRKLGEQLVQGDGTPPNLTGLAATFTGGQLIGAGNGAANGAAPTLADLGKLKSLATASDGSTGAGPDCFVGSLKAERYFASVLEQANLTPMYRWDPDLGVFVLLIRGLPLYVGQVPENETKGTGTNLTSIYALKLHGPTGVHLACSGLGGNVDADGMMAYLVPEQLTVAKRGAGVLMYAGLCYPEVASGVRLNGCDFSGVI